MNLQNLSIEYNFQISIIKSLCKEGVINSGVADKCIRKMKENYLKVVKDTQERSEL